MIFSREKLNIYNIFKTAGSSLGFIQSPVYHANRSKAMSGVNHFNYGKLLSEEIKTRISLAKTGKNHYNFGKFYSEDTKKNIPKSMSKKVFIYSSSTLTILSHKFISSGPGLKEAAKYFNYNYVTISRYLKSSKLFQKQWILFTTKK
jgi:group I intron endonuclease